MEHPQRHSRASNLKNVLVERSYLSEGEVDLLMEAARQRRWGHRDATAILVAYQHGLRASELVALRWDDIDLTAGRLRIRRSKGGAASVHPISAQESLALRQLRDEAAPGHYVFVSEYGDPFRAMGYERMIARAGTEAGFGFVVRSRMLWRELAVERPAAPTMPQCEQVYGSGRTTA
jgi:type 1 fimbriae regulatory protein FimB/type 1 fimbriae regulatory protein FimE